MIESTFAALANGQTLTARKAFHVSPFCDVTGRYAFRFQFGGKRWLARIDYFDDGNDEPLLETWISGAVVPITPNTAKRLVWQYRFFTLGVIARIHWQAVKLWMKHVPFFTKPARSDALMTRST